MEDNEGHIFSHAPLSLTEPDINWKLDDGLINAVITAAVWSVGQRPGVWSKMMTALDKGGRKTKEGTVHAFLFRAMVDRLREEFHSLDA